MAKPQESDYFMYDPIVYTCFLGFLSCLISFSKKC